MGTKILTDCPKCSKRMRIPINYVGTVRCPKCKFQFDKISKLDSETIEEEKPEKTNRCTYCGEINEVVSGFTGYYRCKHCRKHPPLSTHSGMRPADVGGDLIGGRRHYGWADCGHPEPLGSSSHQV